MKKANDSVKESLSSRKRKAFMDKSPYLLLAIPAAAAAVHLFAKLAGRVLGKKCTVSFDGANVPAQRVPSGGKLEEPAAPSREGYSFAGWYAEPANGDAWNFDTDRVTADSTLYAVWDKNAEDPFAEKVLDKDFSGLETAESQESGYEYRLNFLPAAIGSEQPYVGDTMPYYEDGVFYLYYLKDGGDSYNHSIFLTTTTDFLTFTEHDGPIIESTRGGGQDDWAGTGSIVKVGGKYWFFYTGHTHDPSYEYMEKIMLAVGDDLCHFKKVEGWEMVPPVELGQKRDFRDPQACYDPETNKIYMTVTASKDGVAHILKYTMDPDLTGIQYKGILLTDPTKTFWNLECSDCFQIGDTWYVTYSGQNGSLWYAMSDSRFGEYTEPVRLEGRLFYAARHVSDGRNHYMVGWARRSESPSTIHAFSAWGGNMACQQLVQKSDKTLALAPIASVCDAMNQRRALLICGTTVALDVNSSCEVFTAYERFRLTGEFRFTGDGSFGLDFENEKRISVFPEAGYIRLCIDGASADTAELAIHLEKNRDYPFTYVQEGSIGVFYIDGLAALTVRLYGTTGKPIRLFAENNRVVFSCLREYTMP